MGAQAYRAVSVRQVPRVWLNRRRMFQPLSLFVGLRYVRSRTRKFFVSFITWVSLVGVCVGVAALIVILSVMNGFEGQLRDRLLALSTHARVIVAGPAGAAPSVGDWQAVQARLAAAEPLFLIAAERP